MTPASDHAAHDPLLVAALVDRDPDLTTAERAAGRALVASCTTCAALHADLLALATATHDLPTPARTRDFRISPADAARLRPGGWRAWLGAFGSARDTVTRPLAIGLTTIGLAGLLVATVPGILTMGAGAGAAPDSVLSTVGNAVPSAAPPASGAPSAAAAPAAAPEASEAPAEGNLETLAAEEPDVQAYGAAASDAQQRMEGRDTSGGLAQTSDGGPSPLILISAAILMVGLALGALRILARRQARR
jgi:hypothetical protein